MNRYIPILLLYTVFSFAFPAQAKEVITPEQLQRIESLQRRADNLAFGGTSADDYHLSKARTWLDLALSEYYDKDDTGIVSAAISEAGAILDALESRQEARLSMQMPEQVPGSEKIRPDLWEKIAALKKQEKFSCGQRQAAEAEVYLVWAGHEYAEEGASHAAPYERNAENQAYESQVAIDNCAEKPVVAQAAEPPPMERITLSGDALFAFGKTTLNPDALWRLDNLADKIRQLSGIEEIDLVGHTDRLRSDGHPERNQALSKQRAESIKEYLVSKGIAADKIKASGAGSSRPLVQCSTRVSKQKQIECLQPNRRVEIILRGTRQKTEKPATGNPQQPNDPATVQK